MLTTVAPDVQRRLDKIIDIETPKMENILEFWNHVNDPLFSDEMVLSKISIAVRKHKPPNIEGHQFTLNDCKDWFSNPSITEAVLSHLVSVKEREHETDIMIKMNLVTVTFDETSGRHECLYSP